jgi:hypothetical protein
MFHEFGKKFSNICQKRPGKLEDQMIFFKDVKALKKEEKQ